MATHSSVLAWRIPEMGEAWWASVYGVAQSRTRLKQLSSSKNDQHFYFLLARCVMTQSILIDSVNE